MDSGTLGGIYVQNIKGTLGGIKKEYWTTWCNIGGFRELLAE